MDDHALTVNGSPKLVLRPGSTQGVKIPDRRYRELRPSTGATGTAGRSGGPLPHGPNSTGRSTSCCKPKTGQVSEGLFLSEGLTCLGFTCALAA